MQLKRNTIIRKNRIAMVWRMRTKKRKKEWKHLEKKYPRMMEMDSEEEENRGTCTVHRTNR